MSSAATVPGVLQRRKSCTPPGVEKEWREPAVQTVTLVVGYAEREGASESGKQESCNPRYEASASSCNANTLSQKTPYVYESSEAREPVLCIRCTDSGMALTDFADSSWSPKIAAVLRTSLEGGERWARLQLTKLGVSMPRTTGSAAKED